MSKKPSIPLPGMAGMMRRQLEELQGRMLEAQQELENQTVVGSAGGGAVRVTITGQQRVVKVEIDPAALEGGDRELLQDMITAAMNEAITKSQELAAQKMNAVTGGLNLPGLF